MMRYCTPAQYATIRDVAEEHSPEWLRVALDILFATGARPSEVVGCKGRGVDGSKPHHGIRPSDVLPEGRVFLEGKNTVGKKLKPRVAVVAKRSVYEEMVSLAGKRRDNRNLILPDSKDGKMALGKAISRLRPHLPPELRGFTPKQLRHGFAVHAIRQGVDLMTLSAQLGHGGAYGPNLRTTLTYLRWAGPQDEKLRAAFDPPPPPLVRLAIPVECVSCGFHGEVDQQGQWTRESIMGNALRRR